MDLHLDFLISDGICTIQTGKQYKYGVNFDIKI